MAAKRKSSTTPSGDSSKKSKQIDVVEELVPKQDNDEAHFLGDSVPVEEAKQRWPHRYSSEKKSEKRENKNSDDDEELVLARKHYSQAKVDGVVYNLYDDAHVKAGEGEDNYICKIVEFFEGVDGEFYFTSQWFYRAVDTVIKKASSIDGKRVFYSEIKNDNALDCLVEKLKIVKVALNADLKAYKASIGTCDYYYDMHYLLPYSTFVRAPSERGSPCSSENSSTISTDVETNQDKIEVSLLDLYAGCGAMSTGLCLGAQLSNCNLVTKWAVDINKYACESLKLNHPETQVRNEAAEDFLQLLKEWEKLCIRFALINNSDPEKKQKYLFDIEEEEDDDNEEEDDTEDDPENFEVEKVLQICYGDPKESKELGLYFKVSWKNYGEEYDSWEPIEGLGNCRDAIKDFVTRGYRSKILPLPGGVDVICGGPPCQGVSGFNRFRDKENPLRDEKNKQLTVYMDIIKFLKPKYVLMENVVDILKFSSGFLGRHAIGRLIEMNYQTRIGMCAAGAYGLPQFRMRVFLWGANPSNKLPQFPLPTHDVIVRGVVPVEFEGNLVAYDEGKAVELEKKLFLGDAISDLPEVKNDEQRDEMEYEEKPKTEFQRMIRLPRDGSSTAPKQKLYDHQPYVMNNDDYQRSCQIPKRKGACFRDLPGVRVRPDGKVEWDPNVKRVYLPSKKPLVPDYAMSFVNGTSSKPFARLWWDETVPTVVTRPEPHNQAILHPVQDRVLTIRENARLQGFPDYYKLVGPVKERYIQVGNAVAVPVARALGYALGLAFQGFAADEPVFSLPSKFPNISEPNSLASSEEDVA